MTEFNESTKKALAQDFVRYVHEDLLQVKHPHFDIAFRLHEAKLKGYYALLGYDNIYDLAEVEFGFKRSSTKAYISVSENYMNGMQVHSTWQDFGFSQLVEMLSISPWERRQVKATWTVKEIRTWKKNRQSVKLPDGRIRMYGDLTPQQKEEYDASQLTPKPKVDVGQTSGQTETVDLLQELPEEVVSNVEVQPAGRLNLKNKEAREKWLDSYNDWGVWLEVPQLELKVYKFTFANGHSVFVSLSHFFNDMTYNKDKRCTLIRYHLINDKVDFFDLSGVAKTYVLNYMTEKSKEI